MYKVIKAIPSISGGIVEEHLGTYEKKEDANRLAKMTGKVFDVFVIETSTRKA